MSFSYPSYPTPPDSMSSPVLRLGLASSYYGGDGVGGAGGGGGGGGAGGALASAAGPAAAAAEAPIYIQPVATDMTDMTVLPPLPIGQTTSTGQMGQMLHQQHHEQQQHPQQGRPDQAASPRPNENDSYYNPQAINLPPLPGDPTIATASTVGAASDYFHPAQSTILGGAVAASIYPPSQVSTVLPPASIHAHPHRPHSTSTTTGTSHIGSGPPSPRPDSQAHSSYQLPSIAPGKHSYGLASRPRPRKGLIRRMFQRLERFAQRVLRFAREHPLWTTVASALPLLLGAGLVKMVRVVRKLFVPEQQGGGKGVAKSDDREETYSTDGSGMTAARREDGPSLASKASSEASPWWTEEVFKDFRGFGKSCCGTESVDGFLKIAQMLV